MIWAYHTGRAGCLALAFASRASTSGPPGSKQRRRLSARTAGDDEQETRNGRNPDSHSVSLYDLIEDFATASDRLVSSTTISIGDDKVLPSHSTFWKIRRRIMTHEPKPSDETSTAPYPGRPIADQLTKRRRLSVSVINFWIDACILMSLGAVGWISATLQIAFPAPTAAAGWTLWGFGYDDWRDVQFALLCLFACGILIHVMMHWNWVCSVIAVQILRVKQRPDEGMQTIYGVATLIVLLHLIGAGIVAAMLCVHRPPT